MRIIEPSVEIINDHDPLKKIELCGRVCYKSEEKMTETSSVEFVKKIIKRGHESVLEHFQIYIDDTLAPCRTSKHITPLGTRRVGNIRAWRDWLRVESIQQPQMAARIFKILCRDYQELFQDLPVSQRVVSDIDNAYVNEYPYYLTVRFICDRGVSHELVRHRVASFSQESTRYCNYSGEMTFIKPCFEWAKSILTNENIPALSSAREWLYTCERLEDVYKTMLKNGIPPQEARSVLPNSLKTEVVMTATYKEWEAILALRLAPAAHPQMRQVMQMLIALPEFPKEIMTE